MGPHLRVLLPHIVRAQCLPCAGWSAPSSITMLGYFHFYFCSVTFFSIPPLIFSSTLFSLILLIYSECSLSALPLLLLCFVLLQISHHLLHFFSSIFITVQLPFSHLHLPLRHLHLLVFFSSIFLLIFLNPAAR